MKDPSFPFYAQDFTVGVMHFSMAERGVYITLLAYQWVNGKIPKKRLGFILGSEWVECWDTVGEKFKEVEPGFLLNERLEAERDKRAQFKLKQAENGSKGGRPSKIKPKENPTETQTQTQNISQKKPLEDESEYDNEKEKEYEKEGAVEKQKRLPKLKNTEPELNIPFFTENFKTQWQLWKVFRDKEHKFKYKTVISEQAALNDLHNLSSGSEKIAIDIIHQSMAKGWKGFFELKNKPDGQQKSTSERFSDAVNSEAARNFTFGQ